MTSIESTAAQLAPLKAADLEGLSLREAFRRFVLGEDVFFSACHAARQLDVGGHRPASTATALGIFPSFTGLWPVHVNRADLARRWMDPDAASHGHLMTSVYPGHAATEAEREALTEAWIALDEHARAVEGVLARFLAPLRSGEAAAFGHAASGVRLPIAPAWWDRRDSRINPDNGDLCHVVETGFSVDEAREPKGAREQERIAIEWTAVELNIAGVATHIQASEFAQQRDKGDTADETSREILRLTAEIDRLKNATAREKAPSRVRPKNGVKWDFALDKLFFRIYAQGERFDTRGDFSIAMLKILDDTGKEISATQLYTHMGKFYPDFWASLRA